MYYVCVCVCTVCAHRALTQSRTNPNEQHASNHSSYTHTHTRAYDARITRSSNRNEGAPCANSKLPRFEIHASFDGRIIEEYEMNTSKSHANCGRSISIATTSAGMSGASPIVYYPRVTNNNHNNACHKHKIHIMIECVLAGETTTTTTRARVSHIVCTHQWCVL